LILYLYLRIMNKYQEGKIYKIVCNITGEIYIGSTIKTLAQRKADHKSTTNSCVSKNIINRGDYEMILIKNYSCNSKKELEEEEKKYIRENECINKYIPNRTQEEWREDNKQKLKKYQQEYRKKEYETKKEEILKKQQEKVECECGSIVNRNHLARHKKSFKHIKLTECIIID